MHLKSNNIEISSNNNGTEVISKLLESLKKLLMYKN